MTGGGCPASVVSSFKSQKRIHTNSLFQRATATPSACASRLPNIQPVDVLSVQYDMASPELNSSAEIRDYQTVFTNAKAGMEGLSEADKERIKRTVYDMSKDSAHFKNEQRKQAQVDEKVAQLQHRAAKVTAAELAGHQRAIDSKVALLLARADVGRTWVHVDMDAFYASVEELLNPALKAVPMAVGGIGMISTANYPARKFGVRSAMPGFIAKVLCPQLTFVPHNFDRYVEYSHKTRAIFAVYDPNFVAGSLDEAYLDVTDFCSRTGKTGAEVAEELRARVRDETKLTCSCGVACNSMLAKICSDLHKPDGQYVLASTRQAVVAFINTLPVRKIPGIGRVAEQLLGALGVRSCGDVLPQAALLSAVMTPAMMEHILHAALGLGQTRHSEPTPDAEPRRKGISCERTFKPISSKVELEAMATSLVQHLCSDMAEEGIEGRHVTLKLKAATFEVYTRAATLPKHTSQPGDILPTFIKLLHGELPFTARLLGVRMSQLRRKGGGSHALSRFFKRTASGQGHDPSSGQAQQPSLDQQGQAAAAITQTDVAPVSTRISLNEGQGQGDQGQKDLQGRVSEAEEELRRQHTHQHQQQQRQQQQQQHCHSVSTGLAPTASPGPASKQVYEADERSRFSFPSSPGNQAGLHRRFGSFGSEGPEGLSGLWMEEDGCSRSRGESFSPGGGAWYIEGRGEGLGPQSEVGEASHDGGSWGFHPMRGVGQAVSSLAGADSLSRGSDLWWPQEGGSRALGQAQGQGGQGTNSREGGEGAWRELGVQATRPEAGEARSKSEACAGRSPAGSAPFLDAARQAVDRVDCSGLYQRQVPADEAGGCLEEEQEDFGVASLNPWLAGEAGACAHGSGAAQGDCEARIVPRVAQLAASSAATLGLTFCGGASPTKETGDEAGDEGGGFWWGRGGAAQEFGVGDRSDPLHGASGDEGGGRGGGQTGQRGGGGSGSVGAGIGVQPTVERAGSGHWACLACTFTGNLAQILRCSICDTLKGCQYTERPAVVLKGAGGAGGQVRKAGGQQGGRQEKRTRGPALHGQGGGGGGRGGQAAGKRVKVGQGAGPCTLDRFLKRPSPPS